MKKILVIAAHPDDEVLGCGGTMAMHAAAGDEVHVLFLADGVSSRGEAGDSAAASRMEHAHQAAQELGAHPPVTLKLPDNRLDGLDLLDIVQQTEKVVARINPHIVYAHTAADLNIDHRIAHQVVLTVCRPLPGSSVEAIYGFEVLSSTGWASHEMSTPFNPVRFVDISAFLDKKLAALGHYGHEIRGFPHARSVEAVISLAKTRGAMTGMKAAEAFSVIREIIMPEKTL